MLLSEFHTDPDTRILLPPGPGSQAGYLDGAEQQLLQALYDTADLSVASEGLKRHCIDWPTLYHLTPYRSTIFDCFGFSAGDARALELGAGCGAITRWLGEHCAEVHAIEGSFARARVARARCADLPGVHVYCGNYSELTERDAFDLVTLIGVLEYGHLYHPRFGGDPTAAAIDNLRIARRALHGDGVLVLAIENRLGIKYLNGAREDHSGKLFESVQGYPHATSAVTFSAHQLRRMIEAAGFNDVATFLPYPDYKLATTIVNAEHARPEANAHNWLPGTAPDRGSNRTAALFHEALAQREFARAGLLGELANSFLLIAYAGDRQRSDQRHGLETCWRARHYSLDRRPGMQKRVTIGPPGIDLVRNEPALGRAPSGGAGVLDHQFSDEPLEPGELLVYDVHDAIAGAGLGDAFASIVARHRDWLVEEFATGWVDEAGVPLLDGEAFDAIWWNIMRDDDGGWHWIDREWRFRGSLPLDYVVWRTLLHYALNFGLHLPAPWNRGDAVGFAGHWLHQLHPETTGERLKYLVALESAAGRSASGESAAPASAPEMGARVCISASIQELCEDRDLLGSFVNSFEPHEPVILALQTEPNRADSDVGRLREALATIGACEDRMPDVLVSVALDSSARRRAVAGAAAVLTRGAVHNGGRDVRCVASAGALRSLVTECWSNVGHVNAYCPPV